MRPSKHTRGIGTFSFSDIIFGKLTPGSWSVLNNQILSVTKTYDIACFLHIETTAKKLKWRQGILTLSPEDIIWKPTWGRKKVAVDIGESYQLKSLTTRPATFSEYMLHFKPIFVVMSSATEHGIIEFAITGIDTPLWISRVSRYYGSSLNIDVELEEIVGKVRQLAAAETLNKDPC